MKDIYIISDTHFGHSNILKFLDSKGETFRKFSSLEEMDETMIENWNKTVRPQDLVYHMGDVYFGEGYKHLWRLNGHKRLIVGNHDDIMNPRLHNHFEKVMLWRLFKEFNCIMTHVPLHRDSFGKASINLHGHIHQTPSPGTGEYINCCVEWNNYTPVHIEDMVKKKTFELPS